MKLRFLGTGTSFGIPVIGCDCRTCTSSDRRDRRTRHGAFLQSDDTALLVDTPTELRLQLLDAGINHVDAVWFTHAHADHTHGIDDLRVFTHHEIDAYADTACAQFLRHKYGYIFDESYKPIGGPKVNLSLQSFRAGERVAIGDMELTALAFPHGDIQTYGFRVGDLGYVTDAKLVPDEAMKILKGVRVLVLNALWFGHPHPTHMNIEEAVATAREIGAEQTYLTHLTHRVTHAELEAALPDDVRPAYDGLVVEI